LLWIENLLGLWNKGHPVFARRGPTGGMANTNGRNRAWIVNYGPQNEGHWDYYDKIHSIPKWYPWRKLDVEMKI
jgi:hypothetical protein